jgi:cell division protein FtsQ
VSRDDPSIDPRIQDRRLEVLRDERRRRYFRLGAVLLVATVLCLLLAGTRSSVLDVDQVVVSGADRTPAAEVVEVSGVRTGEPMLDLDLGRVAARLEQLPWIQHATASREWPNTIRIVVTERQPVVAVPSEAGGWALVDAEHVVLAQVDEPSERWVRLGGVTTAGPPGSVVDETAADAIDLAPQIPWYLRAALDQLVRTETGELELHLRNGVVVRLGGPDRVAEKLRAINTVFGRVERCGLRTIDLRVPDTPVVSRDPGCLLAPEPDPEATDPTAATPDAEGSARTTTTTPGAPPSTAPPTTAGAPADDPVDAGGA